MSVLTGPSGSAPDKGSQEVISLVDDGGPPVLREVAKQLLVALDYLHSKGVAHSDIKVQEKVLKIIETDAEKGGEQ